MDRFNRIPELDGLRGLAVLMVLAWHFIGSMVNPGGGEIPNLLHAATIFGRTGVDLFFVLSGFLIIGIILRNRNSPNFFSVFYIKRAWRIYPPYLALILFYWACYFIVGESASFNTDHGAGLQIFAQVAFLWNWLMALAGGPVARGFSVTWSVAIEEWFYLTFPLILWALPQNKIVAFLVVAGAGSALLRAAAAVAFEPSLAPYVLPFFRLDGLCLGGLLAIVFQSPRSVKIAIEYQRQVSIIAVIFLATLPLVIASCRDDILRQMYLWGHTYLTIGYAAVLAAVLLNLGSPWLGVLRSNAAIWFGTISYTLYLFHPLFISMYFELAGRAEVVENWVDAALLVGALTTSLAFSWTFYWMVERPSLGRGARARYATVSPAGQR